ncbi:MAG: RdgB/HAM1 family non-canonical purine NTP pyrophosphatase [Saprospiraceae bacterium]|nr:RdgB/HAM1 family non-canonical purine NTP pyrophosphatase [Saprospiraceae bacterium]
MILQKLVFATQNPHKLEEVQQMLVQSAHSMEVPAIIGLDEIGCKEDLPETGSTVQENAVQKARFVFEHYRVDCFAEDTGLFVPSLGGAPGVQSARYAGPERNAQSNMELLLQNLAKEDDRRAYFLTVIACVIDSSIHIFSGKIEGIITQKALGNRGFGYDPIFLPKGYDQTFGQLHQDIKNRISHRAIAMERFIDFLCGTLPK